MTNTNTTPSDLAGIDSGLFTGPAANIGGSSAYHVDIQFRHLFDGTSKRAISQLTDEHYEHIIEVMDGIAEHAAASDHRIEFSNSAVSGQVWDPDVSFEDKKAMAEEVMKAHGGHSFDTSMDFYIAPNGQSRHSANSLSPKPIGVALAPGWKVDYSTAGNYGNYAEIYNENGQHIYTIGHGDSSRELPQDFTATPDYLAGKGVDVAGFSQSGEDGQQVPDNWRDSPFNPLLSWLNLPSPEKLRQGVNENGAEATYNQYEEDKPAILGEQLFQMLFVGMMFFALGEFGRAPDEYDYENNPDAGRDELREYDQEQQPTRQQERDQEASEPSSVGAGNTPPFDVEGLRLDTELDITDLRFLVSDIPDSKPFSPTQVSTASLDKRTPELT